MYPLPNFLGVAGCWGLVLLGYGTRPQSCFQLLFGGDAVRCDVGDGLPAGHGRGPALHVVQFPVVVVRGRTVRERQAGPRGLATMY